MACMLLWTGEIDANEMQITAKSAILLICSEIETRKQENKTQQPENVMFFFL